MIRNIKPLEQIEERWKVYSEIPSLSKNSPEDIYKKCQSWIYCYKKLSKHDIEMLTVSEFNEFLQTLVNPLEADLEKPTGKDFYRTEVMLQEKCFREPTLTEFVEFVEKTRLE